MRRMKKEGADGIYVTDDLGTQTGPFFSPEIFDEFYAPYYKRQIDAAHQMGMHFWLHSCGDIDLHLPKLIDMGLDVIHPIQKFAMDYKDAVTKYGGRICFWAGFDVQQAIPYGTAEEVRAETREMFDTYFRPDGRFMFTLGNGATPDIPIASLEALFEEAYEPFRLPPPRSRRVMSFPVPLPCIDRRLRAAEWISRIPCVFCRRALSPGTPDGSADAWVRCFSADGRLRPFREVGRPPVV